MFILKGNLLNSKIIKTKKGNDLTVHQMLDENPTYSRVIDVADFDNNIKDIKKGEKISIPVSLRLAESKGKTFLNFATAGEMI